MINKIYILFILFIINISLTIYLIYKCFNNKIIEGARDPTGISGRVKKAANKVENAFDSGADAARREAERIAEETRREAERIAEEARRAVERFILDSFEKLLNPISVYLLTLQNTSSVLEQQGGNTNTELELITIDGIGETQKIPKLGRGGGGIINRLARQARENQGV